MKAEYPRSGIIHMVDGTDISYTHHGPGEFSSMIFTPRAREILKDVEIKGVRFKDSTTPRNK